MKERIYSAGKTNGFMREISAIAFDLQSSIRLGYTFASRNLKAKYRQSLLGFFWMFLPPLATAAVWLMLGKAKVVHFDDLKGGYTGYVLSGTMLWQIFVFSVMAPLNAVQNNKSVLVKLNIPKESIFFCALFESIFLATVSFLVLSSVIFFLTDVSVAGLLLNSIPVFIVLLTGLILGTFLVPFAMLYKDVSLGLPTLMQFLMYLSPVVFPASVFAGALAFLNYNPISILLIESRDILFGIDGSIDFVFLISFFLSLIVVSVLAVVIQRKAIELLAERLGN